MTQEDLAGALQRLGWDLARGTLAKIEARLRRVTDAELILLANAFDADVAALFHETELSDVAEVVRQGRV